LFGVLALLGTLLRQRREIARLQRAARREGDAASGAAAGHALPPMIDG